MQEIYSVPFKRSLSIQPIWTSWNRKDNFTVSKFLEQIKINEQDLYATNKITI